MAKARTNKAQHFVPKSYLAAWTDPDTPAHMTPYVWKFPREGGSGRRKAPANVFSETDAYTIPIPGGGRDLRVEHGLSQLENGLEQLRVQFIERRRQIPEARFVRFIALSQPCMVALLHSEIIRGSSGSAC